MKVLLFFIGAHPPKLNAKMSGARFKKDICSECIICSEDISKSTGRVVLSCNHEFHLKCIVGWFMHPPSSLGQSKETCPCCRKEATSYEKLDVNSQEKEKEKAAIILQNAWYNYLHRKLIKMTLVKTLSIINDVSDGEICDDEMRNMVMEYFISMLRVSPNISYLSEVRRGIRVLLS